jgi:hypothetical protein
MDRVAEEPTPQPVKGPAWLAAEEYGLDMTLVEDALRKPVWRRIQEHRSALSLARMLRAAYVKQYGGPGKDS